MLFASVEKIEDGDQNWHGIGGIYLHGKVEDFFGYDIVAVAKDDLDELRAASNEGRGGVECQGFIKSLPPLSFTSSDTSQSDTSQGFKETVQRYVVIVIAMVVVFIIGHAIIELIKNTANTVAGN